MGVDYSSSFGIGIEVDLDGMVDIDSNDYLDELLQDTDYRYIEFGNSYIEEYRFCIILEDPFSGGFNISDKMDVLKHFIENNGVQTIGEFGIVGGIRVW